MYIKTVELKDFRNYDYLKLNFSSKINLIYGDNAQGKTNILEALYIAATTKSHRGAKDDELIKTDVFSDESCFVGEKDAHIKILLSSKYTDDRIDVHLRRNKPKGVALNGIALKRASELFGRVQVVFFCPEDLDIIRRGPGVRRHFLDMDISRMDGIYLREIIGYNKALESRNKLLKNLGFERKKSDEATLDIIDIQLVKFGKQIIRTRKKYIQGLKKITSSIHYDLSGGKEKLDMVYQPSTNEDDFEKELSISREKDIRSGMTSSGPHRDDFNFFINGRDVKKFGSQGQKRTTALSLKLAEIDLAKKNTGDMPILLLDDVLSEFDKERQKFLLKRIGNLQTLITCTGNDDIIKSEINVDKVFNVNNGQVTEEV